MHLSLYIYIWVHFRVAFYAPDDATQLSLVRFVGHTHDRTFVLLACRRHCISSWSHYIIMPLCVHEWDAAEPILVGVRLGFRSRPSGGLARRRGARGVREARAAAGLGGKGGDDAVATSRNSGACSCALSIARTARSKRCGAEPRPQGSFCISGPTLGVESSNT